MSEELPPPVSALFPARELRVRLPTEEAALNAVRTKHGENARKVVEQLADFFQLRR